MSPASTGHVSSSGGRQIVVGDRRYAACVISDSKLTLCRKLPDVLATRNHTILHVYRFDWHLLISSI